MSAIICILYFLISLFKSISKINQNYCVLLKDFEQLIFELSYLHDFPLEGKVHSFLNILKLLMLLAHFYIPHSKHSVGVKARKKGLVSILFLDSSIIILSLMLSFFTTTPKTQK